MTGALDRLLYVDTISSLSMTDRPWQYFLGKENMCRFYVYTFTDGNISDKCICNIFLTEKNKTFVCFLCSTRYIYYVHACYPLPCCNDTCPCSHHFRVCVLATSGVCMQTRFIFLDSSEHCAQNTPFSLTEMAMSMVNRKEHQLRCFDVSGGIIN